MVGSYRDCDDGGGYYRLLTKVWTTLSLIGDGGVYKYEDCPYSNRWNLFSTTTGRKKFCTVLKIVIESIN